MRPLSSSEWEAVRARSFARTDRHQVSGLLVIDASLRLPSRWKHGPPFAKASAGKHRRAARKFVRTQKEAYINAYS